MKYSLILFVFFGLTIGLDAADDKSKEIEMPETFISGDAAKGSPVSYTHLTLPTTMLV